MADPIATLESDLTIFATPVSQGSTGTPADWEATSSGTPATQATLLQIAQTAIGILKNVGSVGQTVGSVGSSLSTALGTAADVMNLVGDAIVHVATVPQPAKPSDITDALNTLQSSLATVQASLPGGTPIFTQADAFFTSLTTYLNTALTQATSELDATATDVYKLSQQLRAVGVALGG